MPIIMGGELKRITIGFAVRGDSRERMENLVCNINYLLRFSYLDIDIIEADKSQHLYVFPHPRIQYTFIEDNMKAFHRAYYMNRILRRANHSVVGLWDVDVVLPEDQIICGINKIHNGSTLCFPYKKEFRFLNQEESIRFRLNNSMQLTPDMGFSMMNRPSFGGAFLVNKERYLQVGGENENFYGWAPDDVERVKRLEILEEPIDRTEGLLFHLYHPVHTPDTSLLLHNKKVLLDVCQMSKTDLMFLISKRHGMFHYINV